MDKDIYLGRSAYQANELDEEFIDFLYEENKKRQNLKDRIIIRTRKTGVTIEEKEVSEIIKVTFKNNKMKNSEPMGFAILPEAKLNMLETAN